MKAKIKDRELRIDIHELLEEITSPNVMSPEEIEEIYISLGFYHPVYDELIRTARDTYVGENYNPDFFNLFKKFFMTPTKSSWDHEEREVFQRMSQAMEAFLHQLTKLRLENRALNSLPDKLYEWARVEFGDKEMADKINVKARELLRNSESGQSFWHEATDIVQQTNYKKWVEAWVDEVYDAFTTK